jgi:hypothetical protein
MPLSLEITTESFNQLTDRYSATLDEAAVERFRMVNILAAERNVPLHLQSTQITDLLMKLVLSADASLTPDAVAEGIYAQLFVKLEEQTACNQRRHGAAGHFDPTPLYKRDLKDQMQDHDMTQLMPNSSQSIAVFSAVNRFDPASIELQQDAIGLALANDDVKYLVFAVGPGHWRGVYLTKPTQENEFYYLELFDPYGPKGARAIRSFILNLLTCSGLDEDLVRVGFTGPDHPQQDSYACGDYTCAYSHKKMNAWGANLSPYHAYFTEALDVMGNKQNALRRVARLVSEDLAKSLKSRQDDKSLPDAPSDEVAQRPKRKILTRKKAMIAKTNPEPDVEEQQGAGLTP